MRGMEADMIQDVVNMILPILITFCLGIMARKLNLINDGGCQTIKNIVSKIMLPVVLVNAFMFADYSGYSVIIMVVVFFAMSAVFGVGYLIRGAIPDRAKYMPFLFSTLECGTLGYPLAAMLYGGAGTSDMAIIDVGHTVFLFMIAVPLLQSTDGSTPDIKGIIRNAFTSPTFDAMLIGILLGVTGVDNVLAGSAVYGTYQNITDFITAPTGMLILLTLGYDMAFRKDLMGPVVYTAILRVVAMGVFCALSAFVIFKLTPFDKSKLVVLMLAYSLPASYGIPMFARFKGHTDYVSTTISFSTILTLIIFIGLTVYAYMAVY